MARSPSGAVDADFERQKWEKDVEFRRQELSIKQHEVEVKDREATTKERDQQLKNRELRVKVLELKRSRFSNPLVSARYISIQ
jgi:hypothetical protein